MLKSLPVGISDFKTVIENNYYYIDKTFFIEEICKNTGKTLLFTRPRRFGKTLNMSTLKYFFDIENVEKNKKLFNNLYIETSDYIKEQGKYPVIFISFKDMKKQSWSDCYKGIRNLISDIFDEHKYLRERLDERNRNKFDKIWFNNDDGDYEGALRDLCKYLFEYHNQKVVILFDEYDTPIVSAYEYNYYDNGINFFKNLYSAVMKDNEYLQIGVMTGILRIAKEGIFSGLNNLTVYTILDEKYSEYFGLTEKEVTEVLDYYGLKYKISDIKLWYDGYKFGNLDIYNPWSILSYIEKKEIDTYWVGTSDNYLINELLENSSINLFDEMKEIFKGKLIEKTLDLNSNLKNLGNPQEIWQLMLYSGYLTVDEKISARTYNLKLPNQEIKSFFYETFIDKFLGNVSSFKKMISNLLKCNIEEFEKGLQEILLMYMSFYDTDKAEEKFYHNLMLGMAISLDENFNVSSNKESGYGRPDMVIEPINKHNTGYIFEFKVAKTEDELSLKAQEGLQQIENKKYDVDLKRKGISKVLILGIAFYGKKVKMEYKFI